MMHYDIFREINFKNKYVKTNYYIHTKTLVEILRT